MGHWLSHLPAELGYGVLSGVLLAVGGWLWTRAARHRGGQSAVAVVDGPVVPRVLPSAPQRFVNRTRELAALDELRLRSETAAAPVVAVVSGLRGVGKSTFSGLWAHRNHRSFSGGVLWADFSRRRHPGGVNVGDVLRDFLREFGLADVAIPASLGDRQRLFAQLSAERRLLMLLDDVDEPAQALAAMPSGPGSVVVVTSAWHLEELIRHGATALPLRPLIRHDAWELLAEMVGRDRLEDDPESTAAIIAACGGLPIAICVCGAKLAVDERRGLGWLADRLAEEDRLEVLSPDGEFDIANVFSTVYVDLDAATARLYRLLGLHPGRDFGVAAAGALAGIAEAEAERLVQRLLDAWLLSRDDQDRLRPHDLVRDHMRGRARTEETSAECDRAIARCVDWYTAGVRRADHAVHDDRLRLGERDVVAALALPTLHTPAQAFAWFDCERHNILAAQRAALEREWDERVWQIAEASWPLCATQKRFDEWIESHRAAIRAGERLHDDRVVARMRSQLARGLSELGDHAGAEEQMALALGAARAAGDDALSASVTEFNGVCLLRADRAEVALETFRDARARFAECGLARGVALQDYHIGWCLIRLEDPRAAVAALQRARDALQDLADPINVGRSLVRLGEARLALGEPELATTTLLEAIDVLERAGLKFEQAEAYEGLATAAQDLDAAELARERRQRAYRLYHELGHPRAELVLRALEAG